MARNQWAMTASACSLAECIHYLGAQYHGRATLPWNKLAPAEKAEKVEAASRYLAAHPPTKGVQFGPDYFGDSAVHTRTRRTSTVTLRYRPSPWKISGIKKKANGSIRRSIRLSIVFRPKRACSRPFTTLRVKGYLSRCPSFASTAVYQASETQGRVLAFVHNDRSMGGAA